MRIQRFDQGDLLAATPALELFFAGDGFVDIAKRIPVEQALHVIFIGEAFPVVKLVFEGALVQVAGDTDL